MSKQGARASVTTLADGQGTDKQSEECTSLAPGRGLQPRKAGERWGGDQPSPLLSVLPATLLSRLGPWKPDSRSQMEGTNQTG